jgi:murein DD-endopeptidase MepM/ murein hydrolase activator NlpD
VNSVSSVIASLLITILSISCEGHPIEKTVEVGGVICTLPDEIAQGDLFLVKVKYRDGEEVKVGGRFLDREIRFFRTEKGEWMGLISACLFDKPGDALLELEIIQGERINHLREEIKVVKKEFGVEYLRLPASKVTLDEKALTRIRKEKKILDRIWEEETPSRHWRGSFILPTKGEYGSPFGVRRIINNEPRSPHTGIDIKAPEGREVLSSNHGEVRFIGDLFFAGKSIIIDHGGGLYTMYFHLSKILVNVGERVKKGEPIGLVGSTGRTTGPHLHFGVRLQGARVNPHLLFSLPAE